MNNCNNSNGYYMDSLRTIIFISWYAICFQIIIIYLCSILNQSFLLLIVNLSVLCLNVVFPKHVIGNSIPWNIFIKRKKRIDKNFNCIYVLLLQIMEFINSCACGILPHLQIGLKRRECKICAGIATAPQMTIIIKEKL